MQEPEIVRLASFERPQAFSPQGQAPLGMAAQLLQDTKDLLELQLWESALILISFLLSGNQQTRELDQTECLVLQGDALRGLSENRRAIVYYRKALRTARASSPADSRRKASPKKVEPGQTSRVSVVFKISLCLEELGDWDAAVKELQGIHRSSRNATINSFLGRMYHRLGRKSRAVDAYKACLQQQPLAIEAAIALASAGIPYEDIAKLAPMMAEVCTPDARTSEPVSSSRCHLREDSEAFMQHSEGPPRENCAPVDASTAQSLETGNLRQAAPCVGVHPDTDLTMSPVLGHTMSNCSPTVHAATNVDVRGVGGSVERCSVLGEELVFPVMPPAATARVWDDIDSTAPVQSHPSLEHGRVPMEDAGPSSGAMDNVPIQTVCQQPGANHRIGGKLLSQPSCPAVVQSESPTAHDRPSKRRRVSTSHVPSVNKEQSQAAFMQQTPQQHPCGVHDSTLRGSVEACKASGHSRSSHGVAFGSPCLTPSPLTDTELSVGSGWRSSGNKGQENDGAEKRSSPKAARCSGPASLAVSERNRAGREGLGWYGVLVQAHVHLCRAQNNAAALLFNRVAAVFPAEIHTLLGAAAALLAAGDQVGALSTYQRARTVDSLNVRGMDAYARLLLELGSTKELHSLSQDMLAVDPELPEVWAVTACFWLQHNDWERALEAVSRGLKYRPDHVGLRLAKGRCLLHKKDCEGALAEFRTVLRSCSDSVAFNGAVHACLMLRRFPEARLHARTALHALPGSASAEYLFGCVLFQTPGESTEDAERHMRRALQLDPGHREAALVIVNMLQQRQDWNSAAGLLRQQLVLRPTDALHVRLGQLFRAAGELGDAADAFQAALGLNAGNRVAIEALEEIGAVQAEAMAARRRSAPCSLAAGSTVESHAQHVHDDGASVDWVARAHSPVNAAWTQLEEDGAPMDA